MVVADNGDTNQQGKKTPCLPHIRSTLAHTSWPFSPPLKVAMTHQTVKRKKKTLFTNTYRVKFNTHPCRIKYNYPSYYLLDKQWSSMWEWKGRGGRLVPGRKKRKGGRCPGVVLQLAASLRRRLRREGFNRPPVAHLPPFLSVSVPSSFWINVVSFFSQRSGGWCHG